MKFAPTRLAVWSGTFGAAWMAWASIAVAAEPPGPSSKRTGLVISEIMYRPPARADGKNLEFIELYNSEPSPASLDGFRLTGDADFLFPPNTTVPALGYLVVAPAPADMQSVDGTGPVLGGFGDLGNALPNDRGTIRLRSKAGAVLLEVSYSDDPPWPAAADGAGHSLVLARPSLGEGDASAWTPSQVLGGSPGGVEPSLEDPSGAVVINEFLARTDDPELDYIELYNRGIQPADISGCILTDNPAIHKFVIPSNTFIPKGGFVHFTESQLGFSLSAEGETIYLKNAGQTRVLDAVRFGPQEIGVATGRFPDGSDAFHRLIGKTPGARNTPVRLSDVVINEIMYHPLSNKDDEQYIELYNRSIQPADLGGWRLTGAIEFTFPDSTVLAPDHYLVVAADATLLRANYPQLTPNNTLGNFSGRLSGRGERLALTMPYRILVTNAAGAVETKTLPLLVQEVTYKTGGRWPIWTDGGGSSLELIDVRSDLRLPSNWASSDESEKAPWTVFEHTGILDHGFGSPDSLQMLLQGPGECLVDDVEVLDPAGANRVTNPTFEDGTAGWVAEGTQDQSGPNPGEGYHSTASFHVRAVDRGDDTINRIRTPLSAPLAAGSVATIRAKTRWLRGHPELLLRLRGNHLEAVGSMTLPRNLGTPGARNSRAAANAGPAIYEVAHSPVLPGANQSVLVTARIDDPDGLSRLTLHYRLDPNTDFTARVMADEGGGGDAIAGDGIFSATVPAQSNGALIAFYLEASDRHEPSAANRFPAEAPARECLVRFGESKPGGSLGTYRIWMTQATFDAWRDRHKLHNTPLDVTFVYNDHRIIYNTQALYSGSPYVSPGYNTPTDNLCGYTGAFPDDDRFLGISELVLDFPARDNIAIQEQTAYWMADQLGLPNNYRRFIRLHVNGVTETQRGSIYEDVQQPGREVIREWVPDDAGGRIFKIERWFEFSDSGARIADPKPTLELFTTTDLSTGQRIKKLARYRWNWLPRAIRGSANDFTDIFALVDAVNAASPEPYTSQTEALVDVEQWMGIFAFEHIINNFDSYGHDIGKNMYAYKPENGRWQMHMFDIDWVMLTSLPRYDTGSSLFACNDPTILRMYNHPPFRRAYFRAVKNAVDGPLEASKVNPWIDAKHSGLVAEGVTRSAGERLATAATVKTWIQERRNYLIEQLAAVASDFAITSHNGDPFTVKTNVITLDGTAPIEVKGIRVNGTTHPITWTTVTSWTMEMPLKKGRNALTFEGHDSAGFPLPGFTSGLDITYDGNDTTLPPLPVFINEWMAANRGSLADPTDGNFDDWFELYNPNSVPMDLAGYSLSDDLSSIPPRWTIPRGTSIPARGFLLIWADEDVGENSPDEPDLHAGFKLNQDGESIGLWGPSGTLIDAVAIGAQTNDVSQGRWHDGEASIYFMSTPTPGGANLIERVIQIVGTSLAGARDVVITWVAEAGKTYRAQFKDNLSAPRWSDLADVLATGPTASITHPLASSPQRFYRIQLLIP